jgi:CDP-diacylglycerol--serine O-phosphatidyltransferase
MRRIRTIAVFPTMFTLGNLICGFFAIVVAARVDSPTSVEMSRAPDIVFRNPGRAVTQFDPTDDTHNCMLSGWLIFLAMIFDALDGHVARLARTNSDFGAQLDSLCDLVTFGVAPGFLLVKMCPQFTFVHRETVWIIAASYAACAALRLARFNVETGEEDDHLHFSGLPSPAAAASIAGFAILFYELRREGNHLTYAATIDQAVQYVLPVFSVIVALLMVSRIPYPHIVNQAFRGQRGMGHVVGLLFALGAIMSIKGYSVPIVCAAFVLIPPLVFLWRRMRAEKPQHEPIF